MFYGGCNNLNKFENYYAEKHEFKNLELTLARIDDAVNESGFTQSTLGKIIHIAGTNGKGSTSYFLYQMLQNSGFKTALFTSPHILKINERIVFNNNEISDDDMDMIFENHKDIIIKYNLSYFEAVFFIALIYFAQNNPDYTILETGLGGRYDATNTSLINDKLCVITSMGYDHAAYLGNNIYSIINEKLGIVRENSNIILAYNKPYVYNYIKSKINNSIDFIDKSESENSSYPYPYSENFSTANRIYKTLLNKEFDKNILLQLPPCRMEQSGRIVLDGSHNMQGVLKIRNTWKKYNFDAILTTVTNDRDIKNTVEILKTVSNNIVVTTLPENIRSIDSFNDDSVKFISSPLEAFDFILKEYKSNILVTGSFYLCAIIKEYIKRCSNV